MLWAQTDPDLLQVYDLVIDRRFEYFMLFWIVMSCGQMMAERPSFSHTSLPYRVRTSCFTMYVYDPFACPGFYFWLCHVTCPFFTTHGLHGNGQLYRA